MPLARPRPEDVELAPEFIALKRQIVDLLHDDLHRIDP